MTMDANEFIAKLKANDTAQDIRDLEPVFNEYKAILGKIPPKDKAPLSLNVLCVLCRNLDKAPKWRDRIDNKALLVLSIDCVRETRAMERADRVKTLACIYHLHRHIVRQTSPIPPELVLKISFMPFEVEAKHLLNEYSKTYWNILVDRLSYIERIRQKIPVIKLLPKLTEDATKIIEIYDIVQLCSSILVFLVKKLHFLFHDKHSKELNQTFAQIFSKISTKDMKPLKKISDNDLMDIYVKLNDCLYVVADSASKMCFKDSPLDNVVRTCISIVGHSPDLFHCLQTFYSNSFCSILTSQTHLTYSETVLNGILVSLETTEKLGYGKAILATYPFLSQFLRLYIEHNVANCTKKPWKENFNVQIQGICLKLMQVLMKRLKNCNQMLKCDNCHVKSGLHDSLRLSFLIKHFITVSISQNIVLTDILTTLYDIIINQYNILTELNELGCVNYEKCFRKLQTDIHNTAISLNKAQYYEFSIKLFDIYLKNEIIVLTEQKNISRALYNKSICELDSKLFETALIDAFLSLVFSGDEVSSEKYMSLVMDIKAKELKAKGEDEKSDGLQIFSVADACEKAMDMKMYGDIRPFFMDLKFSEILVHEYKMYAKLWPSVTPIAGVWLSLLRLCKGQYKFTDENADAIWSLYDVIVETPSMVRTITGEHFDCVLTELLQDLDEEALTPNLKVVYASLLFLKTELDLSAASAKYGWKLTEPISDPDQMPVNRTIPQEYAATKRAIQAVAILSELSSDFDTVSNTKCLQNSLNIFQVYVQLLLHLSRDMEGMQLARICCIIAEHIGDNEAYVRNAGTLLYHGGSDPALQSLVATAAPLCRDRGETAIIFLCNTSIYFSRRGLVGVAARLVQIAQTEILELYENDPEINLDFAVGALMEAQKKLCKDTGLSTLSAVNSTQRHYMAISNTGSKWCVRRYRAVRARVQCGRAARTAARAARALRVGRRARAAVAPALPGAAAVARAALYACVTDPCSFDDAQIKIDNRLKYILGLQPSNETQPYYSATESKKLEQFTPKQEVEAMRENFMFARLQTSPSIPCTSVAAFKTPDWFEHDSKCECYACAMPACSILACQTSGLEAAMYFRANENDIARNYFNGVVKMLHATEERFKCVKRKYTDIYDGLIVESVMEKYKGWFMHVKVEILVELTYFELRNGDFDVADELIVEIHEVIQELNVDCYMSNEIMNLMTCSAQLRKIIKKPEDNSLEVEFENLRLSPAKFEEPKTPITKAKPYKPATKIIVKDEDIYKKRKVIKLNLDDADEKEFKEVRSRKPQFKVPEPMISKHVLEAATPRTRSKPTLVVTQPSEDIDTPLKNTTVYCTPKESTPDQFFTPMTSIKTYKKSLRHNIVKNLEFEFSTPLQGNKDNPEQSRENVKNSRENVKNSRENAKGSRENAKNSRENAKSSRENVKSSRENVKNSQESVEKSQASTSLQVPRTSRSKTKDAKKILKRATSPGVLNKETKPVLRCRRLKSPVNFSLDKDDGR